MTAGIFAAGEGRRLKKNFPHTIKPMVRINGKPLLGWMLLLLKKAGFKKVFILLNSRGKPAKEYLRRKNFGLETKVLTKDTSSSWESFSLLARNLAKHCDRFLLQTVDSFYPPGEVKKMFSSFPNADMVLGVTSRVCDEKPLWTTINPGKKIVKMGKNSADKKRATGGIYILSSALCENMAGAAEYSALRQYLENMAPIRNFFAFEISDGVDVDDERDIPLAEAFLKKHGIS